MGALNIAVEPLLIYIRKCLNSLITLSFVLDKTHGSSCFLINKIDDYLFPRLSTGVLAPLISLQSTPPIRAVETGSLLGFHLRFPHSSYDTIKLTAKWLSDFLIWLWGRPACWTCAHGTQKRNNRITLLNARTTGMMRLEDSVNFKAMHCWAFLASTQQQYTVLHHQWWRGQREIGRIFPTSKFINLSLR